MINKYISPSLHFRLLFYLSIGFIISTVAGTLSHEYGHYLVAKILHIPMKLHYAYTSFVGNTNITSREIILITIGGPIQTMLTGSMGLILLYVNRKKIINSEKLHLKYWLYIFLSMFWLRQTANFTLWISRYLITGNLSTKSDEVKISKYFGWEIWSITLVAAFIGCVISLIVIFTFIPLRQRLTFIASGIIGGISGYIIWLELLGKIIIP